MKRILVSAAGAVLAAVMLVVTVAGNMVALAVCALAFVAFTVGVLAPAAAVVVAGSALVGAVSLSTQVWVWLAGSRRRREPRP
jgi:hypothetical protein